MAVTPNYGWPIPVATDYVKDGYDAIADLGNAIDTTVAGLGSGMNLIASTTFTSQANFTMDNVFSSTYANYKIVLNMTATASSDQILKMYLRSGSPAADNTTSNYYYAVSYRHYNGGTFSGLNNINNTDTYLPSTSGDNCSLELTFTNPNVAAKTAWTGTGAGNISSYFGAGYFNGTTQFTGFKIFSASATMTGRVSVYGLEN